MKIFKVRSSLIVSGIGNIYIPNDPYGIYERLARISLPTIITNKKPPSKISSLDKELNYLRFVRDNFVDFHNKRKSSVVYSFWFLRFVYQYIPAEFWKYNVLVTQYEQKIREMAEKSIREDLFESWVDMPNIARKIKRVPLIDSTLDALYEGRLIIPAYNDISDEVEREWGSTYNYGKLEQAKTKLERSLYV